MNQTTNSPSSEALWQFPCQVNVKVMGKSTFDMVKVVAEVLTPFDKQFDPSTIMLKTSSKGAYLSVTAVIIVQDKPHLEAIYTALNERDEVAWTL